MDISVSSTTYRSTDRGRGRRETRRSRDGRLCAAQPHDDSRLKGLTALELAIIVVLVFAVIAAALASGPSSRPKAVRTSTIRVSAGQSLWTIAAEHPIAGLTTQQTVDAIRRSNHLSGSTIAEGVVLRVPVPSSGAVALAE